jgi:hypothetical protein
MTAPQDPRDIPVLTEAVEHGALNADIAASAAAAKPAPEAVATEASTAIVSATLKLADSLLHQAVKDIEATLFEHVFDQLRAELPELVDRILAERAESAAEITSPPAAPPAAPPKY